MWQLTYLDKVPKQENAFAAYGTLLHSILERYAKGELPLSALPAVYEWEWPSALSGIEWPPNKYVNLEQRYKEQGLSFLNSFPGFPKDLEVLGVEQHFKFPLEDFKLQGFVDLAYRHGDTLTILDWKTAKAYTKAELLHKQRQPYLYSEWVKQEFGRYPDTLCFWHIRDNKPVTIPFRQEEFNEARQWAVDRVHTIRNTWYFPPQPSDFFCKYICSVRGRCEHGNQNY